MSYYVLPSHMSRFQVLFFRRFRSYRALWEGKFQPLTRKSRSHVF